MSREEKQTSRDRMDILKGPLVGNLIAFSLPLAATSILQQLFNSADTAVVGRFDNAQALAAVGTNGEIISLFVSLFTGLSIGANVLIASYIGMGRREKRQFIRSLRLRCSPALLCCSSDSSSQSRSWSSSERRRMSWIWRWNICGCIFWAVPF